MQAAIFRRLMSDIHIIEPVVLENRDATQINTFQTLSNEVI